MRIQSEQSSGILDTGFAQSRLHYVDRKITVGMGSRKLTRDLCDGIESEMRLLKDVPDVVSSNGTEFTFAAIQQIDGIVDHVAGYRKVLGENSCQSAEKRRLAASAFTNYRQRTSGR